MGQTMGQHDLLIDFAYTILNTVFYFTEIGPNSANRVTCFNWDDKCENSVIGTNQTIIRPTPEFLFHSSLLSFNFACNSNTVLFNTLLLFMKALQLVHSLAGSDTGGHELVPSLASTGPETSIASTTCSGSS